MWSIISWEAQRFVKNDEKMKKKRRFLVEFFGQSPRLERLECFEESSFCHHLFIILAFVWSIISWEAQGFVGIPRNPKQNP